jgi:hypothetical protein
VPGDGVHVLFEQPLLAAAPPDRAHRENEGQQRRHEQRQQRQREEQLDKREAAANGAVGRGL